MSCSSEYRWFAVDRCQLCGRCLAECPVLALPEDRAVAEKKRLLSDRAATSLPVRFCTTCNVCDQVCPQQAAPYEQILECFDRQAADRGLPYLAAMVLPAAPENIWAALRPLMSQREQELLGRWAANLENQYETILLTGFYTNLVPCLADLEVVRALGLPVAGSEGLWGCGGDTNKMGLIGLTEQVAVLVDTVFRNMKVATIYCFMQAEAAMLAEVLPERYGADYSFTALPLDNLIRDRINSGQLRLDYPLNLTVTVHDNCMSRCLAGQPQQVSREILAAAGCTVVEMAHHHDRALCCGWAATIPTLYASPSGNPLATVGYLLYSLRRRLREAEDTGADILVTSCPACYLFLTLIQTLTLSRVAVYHLLEVVELAHGGQPLRRTEERCWEILAHTTTLMINWFVSPRARRRFSPPVIDTRAVSSPGGQAPADAARTRRLAALYKSPLVQNLVTRRLLAAVVHLTARLYCAWLNRQKNRA
ncbi:MAG: heterodisulfide reductase-related iron-sulfur binding cluster [Desulfosudaceae bacterium]